jgi:hypothetical protein
MNRSGLVVGQVLLSDGFLADDAVELIRERRSRGALSNQIFVDYLRAGLNLSAELTSLGSG